MHDSRARRIGDLTLRATNA